jgi:rhomboid protease GluP
LGPFAERMLGKWRFIVLYLCSGILAMLGVVGLTRVGFLPPMSLVGASGAIMGLVGATAAVLIVDRLRGASQLAGYRLRGIILIVVIQVIFDSMTPQVSGSAHLLGAAAGLVLGLILYPSRSQPSLAATPAAPVFSLSPEGRGSG